MPRDWKQGLGFLLGFAFALWLGPGVVQVARGEAVDPGLARFEVELFDQTNQVRGAHHLIRLERRADLDAIARRHSLDMAERGYFAHENPEGQNALDRIEAANVEGFSLAAENLGITSERAASHEIVHGWLASKIHRTNLLSPPFNTTGIGVARASDGSLLFTQVYLSVPR